jgi:hypothetical protein
MSVRPGDSFRQADPSAYYAEKLHDVLLGQGVEHYVVTYQYHYYTGHYEEAVGTRTAVVYRDDADSRYPWWLKDDRTATPFWLPAGDLNAQLSFYARRKAEVIEQKHYAAHGGGKEVIKPRHAAQNKVQKTYVAERSQPVTKIALVKPSPAQSAKPVVTYHQPTTAKTAPMQAPATHTAVTKIQRTPSAVSTSKPKPLPEVAASAPETSPATIDPVQQAADPAPRDTHLEKLFRARNGTTYNPTSAVDRRKMEQLKHGLVSKDTTGERGFRRGVDSGTPGTF